MSVNVTPSGTRGQMTAPGPLKGLIFWVNDQNLERPRAPRNSRS